MASQKYLGYLTVVYWKQEGGSFVDISGASRQFELPVEANEVDVTTRDDKNEGANQFIPDIPTRRATLQGLDTTPSASRVWRTININDRGTLLVYPLGTGGTGKPYEYGTGIVTQASYSSPHDGPATWNLAWCINTAITTGTN